MKIIQGNLIALAQEGEFDLIIHGCNCFCTMGAGIAKGIKAIFPQAYEADARTQRGERAKLGTCTFAKIKCGDTALVVVNAYTQFDWRGGGRKVDYDAVRSCLCWVKKHHTGSRIGLPKIGAGLAGGDWSIIAAIVEQELSGEDVTLVEFKS